MIDLLVVGGGPAGLVTALHAAHAGLDVRVWDPRAGTIDKACGEGLMPTALAHLDRLGVRPTGHRLAGIRYVADDRVAEAPFRGPDGLGVRRTTLHDALRDATAAAGVVVDQRAARDVVPHDDRVVVDGVAVRYVVAADGLHSPTRRSLGLDRPPTRLRRRGLRVHHATAPWTSFVEVHWAEHGEAYVTPVADDLVGVAVLTTATGSFDDHLVGFPALQERLGDAPRTNAVRGAGPLRQRASRPVEGRVLLVGDASGYVDALTGEGLALAFAQAEVAVAAIVADDPSRYARDWRRVTWRSALLTSGLVTATRFGPVRRALVPTAAALPRVFRTAVDALA